MDAIVLIAIIVSFLLYLGCTELCIRWLIPPHPTLKQLLTKRSRQSIRKNIRR